MFTASITMTTMLTTSCGMSSSDIKAIINSTKGNDSYRDSDKWGKVVKKDITANAKELTSIDASGGVNINLSQSDKLSIEIHGNENAIKEYIIKVEDGILEVNKKTSITKTSNSAPKITINIKAPDVQELNLSGAGDIEVKGKYVTTNDFNITVSGAGDIEIEDLSCNNSTIAISGSGDLNIKKIKCDNEVDINISGDGDLNAELKANIIRTTISGAGDADLKVDCNNLYATASGTGGIELEGNCINFKKHESGMSSVDSRKLHYKKKL